MQAEVHAPPHWRCIDFISDLHLSADTPLTFSAWAGYLHDTPADAVFILGDLFEVWVGDDVRFDGFEARCAQVLSAVATTRWLGFMVGNRDFLVGAEMLQACGVTALADPCLLSAFNQRMLLTHGDALCLADTDYQAFRSMVRSTTWQTQFLSQPLEARRAYARSVREQSEMRKQSLPSPAEWADIDSQAALGWLQRAGSSTMIHGHTHRPGSTALSRACVRHVLSDWELDHPPLRAEVLRFTADGLSRLPLDSVLG